MPALHRDSRWVANIRPEPAGGRLVATPYWSLWSSGRPTKWLAISSKEAWIRLVALWRYHRLTLLRERFAQLLTLLFECLFGVLLGCAAAEQLRSQGADQGEEADAGCDDRRGDLRAHKRNLVQLAAPGATAPAIGRNPGATRACPGAAWQGTRPQAPGSPSAALGALVHGFAAYPTGAAPGRARPGAASAPRRSLARTWPAT